MQWHGWASHLALFLRRRGNEVVGFARSKSDLLDNTINGDASDISLIKQAIEVGKYDAVINCIGLLNQFAENNKAMAILLNSYLPRYLVEVTKDTKTKVIHMSTDCVFAGNDGPYYEDTLPNGVTFYDRSKAMGEINNDKDLTFRNSIVGPDIKGFQVSVSSIGLWHKKVLSEDLQEPFGQVSPPILWQRPWSRHLRRISQDFITLLITSPLAKFDLCSLFNKYFRGGEVVINPNNKLQIDKSLFRKRTDFSFIVPSYEQQIKEMREWVDAHPSLYSHYNVK